MRVSACRPMIVEAGFRCVKCHQVNHVSFEDGIYMPPAVCHTEK